MASTIDLHWIPLGAAGTGFVRMNGRIYEWLTARLQRRRPLALYHTAMRVHVPEGTFVVETMWPSPSGDPASRGVAVVGPVFARPLSRVRTFRYEVRRWKDGELPDAAQAVGGPQSVSSEVDTARALLGLVPSVPAHTWGRDPLGAGDMWNSNSVLSWLLARVGLRMEGIVAPTGGRAPGWEAGIVAARSGS
jgi:hypothetical protein